MSRHSSVLFVILIGACLLGCSAAGNEVAAARETVTNGIPVTVADQPWAAFLTIHTIHGDTLRCSGTLVTPNRVLTRRRTARFVRPPSMSVSSGCRLPGRRTARRRR